MYSHFIYVDFLQRKGSSSGSDLKERLAQFL